MGNSLEFILKLTDQFSTAMQAAKSVSNNACAGIVNDINRANQSSRTMSLSVNELRQQLEHVNQVRFGTRIANEFNSATRQARELEKQIEKLESKGQKSGSGNWLTGIAAGLSAFTIGSQAMAQQSQAESQQIAFKVMTGSQKEGNALYNNIVKMADVTPYESQDLARSGKTMLNYGVNKKDIMPDLHLLGDVAAAADDPKQSLQELSLAFGQVTAKGHLAGQEALQLVNAGFNPLQEISTITGKSMNDLDKAMSKGAITTDMVKLAFQHATGPSGKFHNMMKEQSETLGGKWSTFMDSVHHKLRDLGKILEPITKVVMDFGTALLDNTPGLAMIAGGIGLVAIATGGWSAAQGVLNFIMNMNPIVRIVSLILILGGIIYTIARRYEGWGKSMEAVWEIAKLFIKLNITAWKSFAETIGYYIDYGKLKFQVFTEYISGAVQNVLNAFALLKAHDFSGAKNALFKDIVTPSSKAIDELKAKHKASQAEFLTTGAATVKAMADNYSKIGLHKIVGAKATDATLENAPDYKLGFAHLDDGKDGKSAKSKADSINSGGQRSIVINIGKQIERLEMHVMSAKEGAAEIEAAVREAMKRVLYATNDQAV